MTYNDFKRRLSQDSEYMKAKEELKPSLILADNILRLRLERGWSQTELARRAGTKQANISKIESSLGNPTLKFIKKLADTFDVELYTLLREETETNEGVYQVHWETPIDQQPRYQTRYISDAQQE
jgi:transcriptional regulator with XRE-family HTH domain